MGATRASFIGGAAGTSNTLAGKIYGIPVMGTMAHSWIMAFPNELEAFRAYAKIYPTNAIFLIDTYDTLKSGIKNAIGIKNMRMMFPITLYWITKKEEWLKKCMLPMAVTEDNITDDIYQTAKLSIDYAKIKTRMPSNVDGKRMRKCKAPTLVMGAEKDCLFPGIRVLTRAKRIIPNCMTYLLRGRGHMHFLTEKEKRMIVSFLLERRAD
jgi:homoserine acetyltransferase